MPSAKTSPLTPADWIQAALDATADGGIGNISVERLAKGLGTTKGSFYWHFKDRPALVAAALDVWAAQTEAIIQRVEEVEAPRERFRLLISSVFEEGPAGRVELALLADADLPAVADTLERVTARRLAFIAGLLDQMGADDAEDRALFVYTAFLGLLQLRRASPKAVPEGRRLDAYVASLIDRLLP